MLLKQTSAGRDVVREEKDSLIVSYDAISSFDGRFDRKEYMKIHKGISAATVSRDLKQLLKDEKIVSSGAGRMTKYKKRA